MTRLARCLAFVTIALAALLPDDAAARKDRSGVDPAFEAKLLRQLRLPPGFRIGQFAGGLGNVRLMVLTPEGDLVVSVPPGRVILVKGDGDGDGRSDGVRTLVDGLNLPHGLTLDGGWLYIAEEDQVIRLAFKAGQVAGKPETVLDGMPDDGGHITRTLRKGPDGRFYVSIGSSCNVCIESHPWRAAMLRFQPGGKPELFATGLRNTVGFDWQPRTGALYGVDNGRDWLGDEFPPDEVNRIVEGGFYGWPILNGANVPDPDFGKRDNPRKDRAIAPAHSFAAHVAPLSIRFLRHQKAPGLKSAALAAQHGSWNRSRKIGYRIVSLHWDSSGAISQKPFLTGFEKNEIVSGRPVDIVEAPDGTLFVSDDYGEAIWRIVYEPQ